MDTQNALLANPAVNVWQKSTSILLKAQKDMENHPFFNEKSSHFSSGHAECSFDNPCRFSFAQSGKISLKLQNLSERRLFLKKSFSNCFPGHVGYGFKTLVVNFWANFLCFFAGKTEIIWYHQFWNKTFSQKFSLDT